MRPWSQRLFSQAISQPSHGASFADWWTSSLRASRVRQSASQESGSARKTTDGSGPTSCVGSRSSSLESLSSKTCPVCALAPEREVVAYAAGLIDGEGSISIGMGTRTRYLQFNVAIHVEMATKHHNALNALVMSFGGDILANRERTEKHAATLTWRVHGAMAGCVLKRILPFLRSKARIATEVLALLQRDERREPLPNGRLPWTEERRADYMDTRARVMKLNQRGPELTDQSAFAILVGNRWVQRTNDLFGERLETFSGTWPRSGSVSHGRACELRMSAPAMNGSASSSSVWPTATAQDSESTSGSNPQWGHGSTLTDATRKWTTPQAHDVTERGLGQIPSGKAGNACLARDARTWATPTTRDHKGMDQPGRNGGTSLAEQTERGRFSHRVPTIPDGRESLPSSPSSRRRLNPVFVCWLMGWPTWWTNVGPTACARSEMASYLSRLRSLCDFYCSTSAIEAAA